MKRKSVFIFYLLLLLLSIVPAVWLFSVGYDEFCRLILTKGGKLYKLAEFQSQYLTPARFSILRAGTVIFPLLISVSVYFAARNGFVQNKLSSFGAGLQYLFELFKKGVSNIPTIERSIIIAFFSAFSLRTFYHALTSPITSDEAWTYLIFISRGLPVTLSLNYSPNNHILYSILGCFSFYLPFDSTFNLRLPSLIITVICSILFFVSIRLLFNTLTAFLTTSLLVSLYPFMYYSLQARGYLLITLLFTLCFFSIVGILKTGRREFWVIFTAAAILGAYTIPSFLYPFVSLSLFAFLYLVLERRWQEIKNLIITGTLIGIGVFLLYLPIFVMSGVSALVANEYVHPISRAVVIQSLPEYSIQFLWWMFGNFLVGLILLVGSLFVKTTKNKLLVKISFFCLLLVPVICVLHSVLPYVRVWIYLIIAASAAAALTIEKIIAKFKLNIWAVSLLCLIILALGEYNYIHKISADEYETRAAKSKIYTQFLTDASLRNFYIEEHSTSIYVDYYLTTHHRNYKIQYGFTDAFDAAQNYDCVILKADNPLTTVLLGYKLVYADDISKIFVKSQ